MLKHVVSLALQTRESFERNNNPKPSLSFLPLLAEAGTEECLEGLTAMFSVSPLLVVLADFTCAGPDTLRSLLGGMLVVSPGYARCDLNAEINEVNIAEQ